MKDNYGDEITCRPMRCPCCADVIRLDCRDENGKFIDMALSPKKARKLAKKLLRLADEIEAR